MASAVMHVAAQYLYHVVRHGIAEYPSQSGRVMVRAADLICVILITSGLALTCLIYMRWS